MGVYLTGVHLTGVHLMGVHLMGVHLIDVYFMDVHMFPNQKRFWGKPPEPPTLQTVVDLPRSELQNTNFAPVAGWVGSPLLRDAHAQPCQAIPSSTEVMILS